MNVALKLIYSIHKGAKLDYNILLLVKNNVGPNCCSKWIAKLNCDISWKCCFQKIPKIKKAGVIMKPYYQKRILIFALSYIFK